jgi:hypothetical protein
MKEIWCLINTALVILLAIYITIIKDLNTKAYDKCVELEKKVELQEERCNHLSEIVTQKDTVVINIKNYNYYKK